MLENHALIFIVTTIPFPRKPSFIVKRWGWSDISCFGPVTQRPPPSTSKKAFCCFPNPANYPRFNMFSFSKKTGSLLWWYYYIKVWSFWANFFPWAKEICRFWSWPGYRSWSLLPIILLSTIRCFSGDALYIYTNKALDFSLVMYKTRLTAAMWKCTSMQQYLDVYFLLNSCYFYGFVSVDHHAINKNSWASTFLSFKWNPS